MTARSGSAVRGRWVQAGMVVALVGSFLSVALPWAHGCLGAVFAALAAGHVLARRRLHRLVRQRRRRRAAATALLATAGAATTATGLAQWSGASWAVAWHGGTSVLVVLLTTDHALRRWRGHHVPHRPGGAVVEENAGDTGEMSSRDQTQRDRPQRDRPRRGEPGWGERAAVLAAALVWLVLLVFPVLELVDQPPPVEALVPALMAMLVLLWAYLRAVVVVTRLGPPQARPAELIAVAAIAVLLPLFLGPIWFGATVLLAALTGISAPAARALVGTAAAAVAAVGVGAAVGAPVPQLLAVPVVTALAGVLVVLVVHQVALGRELARVSAEAERLRLARELHDLVKQQTFVAAMEVGAARARGAATGRCDSDLLAHLDAASAAVGNAAHQLAGVLDDLRSDPHRAGTDETRDELGPALRRLVEDWSRRTGLDVDLDIATGDDTAPEPLLVVAAEALANVERHARASRVNVALRLDDGWDELLVRDDGAGFDPTASTGHGLRGTRERLTEAGGTLQVRSDGTGTTVLARSPR